jgi:hypothetical protein
MVANQFTGVVSIGSTTAGMSSAEFCSEVTTVSGSAVGSLETIIGVGALSSDSLGLQHADRPRTRTNKNLDIVAPMF